MKRQIEGQLSLQMDALEPAKKELTFSDELNSLYNSAAEYAVKNGSMRVGTAMRVFKISSAKAQKLVARLKENGIVVGIDCRTVKRSELPQTVKVSGFC
ncbi:hypothetical protein LKD70_14915 [Ruminococcus sp. CLA-AA-H200]|uniref:FtsK gamma domain-containing protein n=1 Tax=Ruminococcus turbiniformis TaxID=2881258 RepID=A0ABS8G1C5_9FIRM|nr:hypothetical protein [Ruminococcus turbiniformis]MCC2255684.1 hypothetical protein [Ruminococcus turbiniformis]